MSARDDHLHSVQALLTGIDDVSGLLTATSEKLDGTLALATAAFGTEPATGPARDAANELRVVGGIIEQLQRSLTEARTNTADYLSLL